MPAGHRNATERGDRAIEPIYEYGIRHSRVAADRAIAELESEASITPEQRAAVRALAFRLTLAILPTREQLERVDTPNTAAALFNPEAAR